jgi:hypothetical protein
VSITGFDVLNINAGAPLTAMAGNGEVGMVTLAANAQAGSTLTINDAVTADGPATLTGNGSLVVNGPVTANSGDITLTGAAIMVNAPNGSVTTNNGNITLNADAMMFNGPVSATVSSGTSVVTLLPLTPTLGIDLGADSGSGNLVLTNTDLNNTTAGVLRIGDVTEQGNTGDIQLTADVTLSSGVNTLALSTGGAITDSGGFTLTVTNLALLAANRIGGTSPFLTAVSNLAFNNTTSGAVQITNTGALTVTAVDTLATSMNQATPSAPTMLTATSPITFAVNTTSVGTLTATAQETPTPSFDNVTVNTGVTVQATGGDVIFQAGDDIVISAGATVQASGNVTLTAGFQDVDNEGMIQINGTVLASLLTGVVTLNVGTVGPALEGAAGSIQANGLLLLGTGAAGSFTLDSALNQVSVLAASTAAAIVFENNAALAVGSVAGTNGVTSSNGDITLCNLAGNLTLNQPVNAGIEMVRLSSAGSVTATAAITAGDLGVLSAGLIDLCTVANTVTGLFAAQNADTTASAIRFLDNVSFTVGAVTADPVSPACFGGATGVITGAGGAISLRTVTGDLILNQAVASGTMMTHSAVRLDSGGGVTQNAAGAITAGDLGVIAVGPVALAGATNTVTGVFAALTTGANGSVMFQSTGTITLGTVSADAPCFPQAVSGVTTAGQDVTLCATAGGNLAINQAVSAAGGTVRLTAAGTVTQTAAITSANLGVLAGGAITLNLNVPGNQVTGTFAASNAPTNTTSFADASGFQVGSVSASICFIGVTGVSGTTITLSSTQGSLLIAAPITGGAITLSAGGGVTQTAQGGITGTILNVTSHGQIDLCLATVNPNSVSTFSAQNNDTTASPILFQDNIGFNLGTGGVVTTAGGDITLNAAGNLNLSAPVTSGTPGHRGTVRLSAGGFVNQSSPVAAMDLGLRAGGLISLDDLNNSVTRIFAADAAGNSLSFVDTVGFQVDTVGSDSCFTQVAGVTGGGINLTASAGNVLVTAPITGILIQLTVSGGSVTQTVAGYISGTSLTVHSGGQIDLCVGPNNVANFTATDNSAAASAILFQNSQDLTVGGATTQAGGDITLRTGGSLMVNAPVISGTLGTFYGTVRLHAGANVTDTANGVITAANLGVRAVGGFMNLSGVTNSVFGAFAATAAGPISFSNGPSFTVAGVSADPIHAGCFAAVDGVTNVNNNPITLTTLHAMTVNRPIGTPTTGAILLQIGQLQVGATATFNYDPSFGLAATITGATATVQDTNNPSNPGTLVMNYKIMIMPTTTTWDVTGQNAGTVSNSQILVPPPGPGLMSFQNFGTLIGGPGPDYFKFENAGNVTGNVDGMAGLNTLDFTAKTYAINVHLSPPGPFGFSGTTTATPPNLPPIGGMFFNINQIFNNDNSGSTLIGPDADTSWTINAQNAGFLMSQGFTLFFTGFPNLTGGSANDVFTFVNVTSPPSIGSLTGKLDGGAGMNTLRYSDPTAATFTGYYYVNVRLTALGPLAGFNGTDGGVIIAQGFMDICNLDGGYALAGNSLTGADLGPAVWNVNQVQDPQYPGGNVGGNYTTSGRTLYFSRFQTLNGGMPSNTFNVSSTPMGVLTTLNGNASDDVFNVGVAYDTTGLDKIQGPLSINGGGFNPQDPPLNSAAVTVTCPPRTPVMDVYGGLALGDQLNIQDQTNPNGSSYTLDEETGASTNFSRQESGGMHPVGAITFVAVQSVFLNTGTAANSVHVVATYAYTRTVITAFGSAADSFLVDTTGTASYTEIDGNAGADAFQVSATGTNSNTVINAHSPSNTITVAPTGTSSILTVNGGSGTDMLLVQQTGTGSAVKVVKSTGTLDFRTGFLGMSSGELLAGGAAMLTVHLPSNPPPFQNPNLLIQITGSSATTVQFDFSLNEYRAGANQIVLATNTSFPVVCFAGNLNVPQKNFVVSSYLIPSGSPFVKPTISIFVSGGFINPGQLLSTPFAPVVAQPTFNSEFGYSPPTVTVADVNGDGAPDLIVAMGSGFEPLVTVFDGNTIFLAGNALSSQVGLLAQFFAFDTTFVDGDYVAAGNLTVRTPPPSSNVNPSRPDLIVGAGRGGSPLVQVFEYLPNTFNPSVFPGGGVFLRNSFLAYNGAFTGGVRVAAGDVYGDNRDDIITAAGPGLLGPGEAQVRVWNAVNQLTNQFNPYPGFTGGVFVAAGNYNGRTTSSGVPIADILTGPGSGGSPIIDVFSLVAPGVPPAAPSFSFMAFMDPGSPGIVNGTDPRTAGVSSVAFSIDPANGRLDIVVGSGEGRPSETQAFNPLLGLADAFFTASGGVTGVYDPNSVVLGGVAVGGLVP